MFRPPPPCLLAAALVVLVAAPACRKGEPGTSIRSVEFVDLPTPAMFERLCQQLRRPYVLELPPWPVNESFNLAVERTTERDVLGMLHRLDLRFDYALAGKAAACWPAGAEGEGSPFARIVPTFQASGGAAAVIQTLLAESGLLDETMVQSDPAGQHRPVQLDMQGRSVRDLLVEIAAQAHLGMRNEPGVVRVFTVPE